ncbi:MAG: fused MFS/spermidine synthase [bacterium]
MTPVENPPAGAEDRRRLTVSVRRVILLCFFLSGLSGLVYEIVWVRQFTLIFGNTVYAVGAVLAAFMGGLGLGGFHFGRRIDRSGHPVLVYGVLESGVGLYALALPLLMRWLQSAAPPVFAAFHESREALFIFRFGASFILLFVPTFFMGASLPLLTNYFVRERALFGHVVSFLYGLNTLGAVAGVFLATFLMIPYAGHGRTILMAFIINAGVGLLSVIQFLKLREAGLAAPAGAPAEADETVPAAGGSRVVLAVAFLSGFTAMIFEIAWTRAIALIIGSSIYSFSLILTAFLLGISVGGFVCSRYYAGRRTATMSALAFCQAAVVVSSAVILPALPWVVMVFINLVPVVETGHVMTFGSKFFICLALLLVPTVFLGISFPLAAELYLGGGRRSATAVGKVYLYNTFGTIGGSILTGFVLISAIGVRSTLLFGLGAGTLSAIAALAGAHESGVVKRLAWAAVSAAAVLVAAASPFWSQKLMTTGPFLYARMIKSGLSPSGFIRAVERESGDLLFYHDGPVSTVSVHKKGAHLSLKVNGKTDASNAADMPTQALSGYLPLLLSRGTGSVLVIGIGSGTTAGAALEFPIKKLRCVEIERAVLEASKFFEEINRGYWKDRRAEIVIEDARNFLVTDREKYDVIISEPSNPWMAGVGSLFTTETYEMMLRRLKPGGIVCQWVHTYMLTEGNLLMALSTFADVFPYFHVFRGASNDLLLMGSNRAIDLDFRRIQERIDSLPGVKKGLKKLEILDSLSLLVSSYVISRNDLEKYLEGVLLRNTDDTPYLEYFAPLDLRHSPFDFLGKYYWDNKDAFAPVFGAEEKDFTAVTYHSLGKQYRHRHVNPDEAEEMLRKSIEKAPRYVPPRLELAEMTHQRGKYFLAERHYKKVLEINPENSNAVMNLVSLYIEQGLEEEAEDRVSDLLESDPRNPRLHALSGKVALTAKKWKEAMERYGRAEALAGKKGRGLLAEIYSSIAFAAEKLEMNGEAVRYLEKLSALNPADIRPVLQIAMYALENGELEKSGTYVRKARAINPSEPLLIHIENEIMRMRQRGGK